MSERRAEEDENAEGKPEEIEVLDEEFECYKRVAESIIRSLKRPKDIQVGNEMLSLFDSLKNTKFIRLKKKCSEFFRLFLRILNWTSINQPLDIYKLWYPTRSDSMPNTSPWMEPNKSYMASKTLDDGTVIIYSAVATGDNGWQQNGLKILYDSKKKDDDK